MSLFAAIAATSAALEGHADAGVVIDSSGRVGAVSRTGFAWRDGIRPGQTVVQTSRSDAPGGWALITEGPAGRVLSREAPVVEALRASLPLALVALAAGCVGVASLRLNRAWVLPCASLALVGASAPLFLANQGLTGPVLASGAIIPVLGIAHRIRRRRVLAAGLVVGCVGLAITWTRGYMEGIPMDSLEEVRRATAIGATGLLMADRAMRNRPGRITRREAVGLILAAAVIAAGLALMYFAAFPAPIIAIAVLVALLVVQPIRSLVGRRLELALMADLRQQVAADVAEEERGRLARELHDSPLQELAGVIRRLELVPEAHNETRSLLAIADQLRGVAVDLRPPMLDDIGLGAALDFLAEQVTSPSTAVEIQIDDVTSLDRASRPPAAVEFALYRIAREAVGNALRHANAREVRIEGSIALDAVDLTVVDDGVGLSRDEPRRASGRGRLGLASMRRRAQAIGAELAIDGGHAGTRVSVSWRR